MKLIMLKDVKKIGQKGHIIEAADGYANSFLIPRKMAKIANANDIKNARASATAKQDKINTAKQQHDDLFRRMNKKKIAVPASANTNGHLFAAVQKTDITEQLPGLKPEHIVMKDAIKEIGDFEIPILIGGNKGMIIAKIESK